MTALLPLLGRLLAGAVGTCQVVVALWICAFPGWASWKERALGELLVALVLAGFIGSVGLGLLLLAVLG